MARSLWMGAALGIAALAATPAHAQLGVHAGELEVPVNKSQVVTADTAIDRAMVGNAAIADVVPVSERSVYVLGKAMGTTSLTLYDRSNRVIAVMDIDVGPDVDGLRTQLGELIPNQPIDARISNGSIVLSGMVTDPGAADRAFKIAAAYAGDKVVNLISVGGSQQVMLEVRFAEVNRSVGQNLGVSGFGNSSNGNFGAAIGNGASVTGGTAGAAAQLGISSIADNFGVFSAIFNLGNVSIQAFLNSLERKGLSRTLASPTLVALSGERASFLAGGEFPIPVAQGGTTGTNGGGGAISVEFKPFGVSLGFTPTVLGDKVINLVVEPEVSTLDPSASVTVNGLTVPGLQTRRASTTLELRDGESFAIAGLLRDETTTSVNQLPLLGSIPVLGTLFRSSKYQKGETELLIVVTPHLVQPIRPSQVRLPTDRIAAPTAPDVLLNGDDYQPRQLTSPDGATAKKGPGYEF